MRKIIAKVQIKSEKITPFGGIFHVREQFSRFVGPVIDKVLGLRCTSFGYQYGEIAGSLASVYDQSYFIRMYRKVTGTTPQEYRKQQGLS